MEASPEHPGSPSGRSERAAARGDDAMQSEPAVAQCRFCLEDAPIEELLAPCRCEGTSRFVHAACLRRWQRQVATDQRSAICSVCKSVFKLAPAIESTFEQLVDVVDFEDWNWPLTPEQRVVPIFDSVRASPRYGRSPQRLSGSLHESMARLLAPGCIILQTQQLADTERRLAQAPQPTDSDGDVFAFFEAVLNTRISYFHKGAFLLAAMWPGKAVDGSDVLLGVNLAGASTDLERIDNLRDLKARLHGAPISASLGGLVKPARSLCLVVFQGDVLADYLPHLVQLVRPAEWASRQQDAPAAAVGTETADELAEDLRSADFEQNAQGEMQSQRRPLRLPAAAPATRVDGALFGEPHDVAAVLECQRQLRPVAARVFQGHAVWSSSQLFSEIVGGSWGITKAGADDLIKGCRAQEAESCWENFWETHDILDFTEVSSTMTPSSSSSGSTASSPPPDRFPEVAAYGPPRRFDTDSTELDISNPLSCMPLGLGFPAAARPHSSAVIMSRSDVPETQPGCDLQQGCLIA